MRNKIHWIISLVLTIICFLICVMTFWIYQASKRDDSFECYSLITFSRPLSVGNMTLLAHFMLGENDNGVITFTGENDKAGTTHKVSREIHFNYIWQGDGKVKLYKISTLVNPSDTTSDDVFKSNVFDFQRPEINMMIHRLKNSYILGGLAAPISVCVDKDEVDY